MTCTFETLQFTVLPAKVLIDYIYRFLSNTHKVDIYRPLWESWEYHWLVSAALYRHICRTCHSLLCVHKTQTSVKLITALIFYSLILISYRANPATANLFNLISYLLLWQLYDSVDSVRLSVLPEGGCSSSGPRYSTLLTVKFEFKDPPNPPSRTAPSEQQPWVGELGSWHRRLLDNATSVTGGEERSVWSC